jgi:chemotaxis protein MotA
VDHFAQRKRIRLDYVSLLLVPAGLVLVVLSQAWHGVPMDSLLQWQAALIVLGGTTAAIMVSYTPRELCSAVQAAARTFKADDDDTDGLATALLTMSIRAHKRGALVLESDLEHMADPFLREGLQLAIDDSSLETVRELMAVDSANRAEEEEAPARVFEAAAGYAPTLGILGAVLGLVQVMQNLSAPGTLGPGIATAFVATVYGVGAANLVLLPVAGRLRERAAQAQRRRDMMTHAVCAIALRTNPRLVAQKLRAFSTHMPRIEDISRRSSAQSRIPSV